MTRPVQLPGGGSQSIVLAVERSDSVLIAPSKGLHDFTRGSTGTLRTQKPKANVRGKSSSVQLVATILTDVTSAMAGALYSSCKEPPNGGRLTFKLIDVTAAVPPLDQGTPLAAR